MKTIERSVNVSFKDKITERELAVAVLSDSTSEDALPYLMVLFTEIPNQDLAAFAKKWGIGTEALCGFYKKHIAPLAKNIEFEEMMEP